VTDPGVDEEVGIGERTNEVVLHLPRHEGVAITPDQERRRLNQRKLGCIVVSKEFRERFLPDVCGTFRSSFTSTSSSSGETSSDEVAATPDSRHAAPQAYEGGTPTADGSR
jgi:hypothetical protein